MDYESRATVLCCGNQKAHGQCAVALTLAYAGDPNGAQAVADGLAKRDTIAQFNYVPTLRTKLALDYLNPQQAPVDLVSGEAYLATVMGH